MTIFKDTVFLDIIGWTTGDGLIATDGNVQITGSLDMTGTITAREFHTELVSSSIIYLSGSTLFGDTLDDVHERTGSMLITGSLNVNNGALFISSSGNVGIGTITPDDPLVILGTLSFRTADGTETRGKWVPGVVGSADGAIHISGKDTSTSILFAAGDDAVSWFKQGTLSIFNNSIESGFRFQVSGSAKFGDLLLEQHQFTGSVGITGSLILGVSGSVDGKDNRIVAVTGSFQKLEKATGTFKIPHPDPSKSDKNLYHSFVESPTAGDNIYRFEIQAFSDNEQVTIDLPEYFRFLNEKPHIFVQALGQFSNAYASVDQHLKKLRVVCEKKGFYDVLLIATRKDKDAVQAWSGTERDK